MNTNNTRMPFIPLALAALLLTMPLVGVVGASSGSVTAIIASPANGSTHTRIGDVVFADGSTDNSCPITTWAWTFGDGGTSALQAPHHRYTALGTYSVSLTVTGSCGATSSAAISVVVQNIQPIAVAGATPVTVAAGTPLTLTSGTSRDLDGSLVEYRFSLDGVAFPPQVGSSLATNAPTLVGTHVVSLVVVDNEGGVSPPSNANFNVVADALYRIAVAGPATMTVGSTATFVPSGFDQYDNARTLATTQFSFTAPTSPGTATASYTESGITGSATVEVVTDQLFRIEVDGPSTMVAGTSGTYTFAGFDQYDNPVALAETSVLANAPTSAGPTMICYTESSVSGCKAVSIVADDLASIALSGPASLVAGTTGSYALSGADQYGNPVGLATSSVSFSRTQAGPATVSYTEDGITGSLPITIVHDALDHILVTGPTTLVAGDSASFSLAGFDQFENAVALAQSSLSWTAPEVTGAYTVSYTELGVTGTLAVTVVSDQLFQLFVDGPDSPVAGTDVLYTFSGIDQYGNPVTLDPTQRVFTLPTSVGIFDVCEEQQGIIGCLTVDVIPDVLASITLAGPGSLVAGTSASYSLTGFDQYGNAVTLAQTSLSYTASTAVGAYTASYTELGVTGTHPVTVVADALASISLAGPIFPVAGTSNAYAADGFDQYGNDVPLAQPMPSFLAPTATGPATFAHSQGAVTGTIDVTVVHAALDNIVVSGPNPIVAGTTRAYHADGFDQYGNDVPLAAPDFDFTASTSVGPAQVCTTEGAVTGCLAIAIVADSLDEIIVSGANAMAAGTTDDFDLSGFDQHGNPVALAQSSLSFTAPTSVGSAIVSYTEGGVTGSKSVQIVADALATISVTGPDTLVAGETADYDVAGFDQYGNAVTLAVASVSHTAPLLAGPDTVSYTETGVTGAKAIMVVADELFEIVVTGPGTLTVATTASYHAEGYDANGNEVTLPEPDFDFTAPTTAGTADVCTTQLGVTGCKLDVAIVAAGLDHIVVSGAHTIVAGHVSPYTYAGFDLYNNPVALAVAGTSFVDYDIPSGTVSYTENGVTGTLVVTVIADDLVSIDVSGPGTLVAGTSGTYALSGEDQWGNPVVLAQSTLTYNASTVVGSYTVLYVESGVSGSQPVNVVPDALASILLTGPSQVPAGSLTSYAIDGFDQYGNDVPTAQSSVDSQAPPTTGPITVTYSEGGVIGTKSVQVVAAALARIAISGADDMVAGSSATFGLNGFDAYNNPVALPASSLAYTAPTLVGHYNVTYTHAGVTGVRPIEVVAGLPEYILVEGPASLIAGDSADYALSGYDIYNNPVELDQETQTFTAPTAIGPTQFCYIESGVEGCANVEVVSAELTSIEVSGPDPIVAGTTNGFTAEGFDQFGNPVDLGSAASFDFTAPTSVGPVSVVHAVGNVTGTLSVVVVADALATIDVLGLNTQTAGTVHSFGVEGFDQYGNAVALDTSSVLGQAPTTVGSYVVSYTEDGVTGSKTVQVVADSLATLSLTGPGSLVANTAASYAISGTDQYGNPVTTSPASREFTAPTATGATQFCETQSGVSDCIEVQVVADALASISVSGPASLVAGSSGTFALAGFDQYGNDVTLAQTSMVHTASETVGPEVVSYTESGITGTKTIQVVADSLESIEVAGPATMVAGSTATFDLTGFDQYGNTVPLAQSSLAHVASIMVGTDVVSYTENGVTGTTTVDVVPDALASIAVAGPDPIVAGTTGTYSLAGADQYGNAVALAQSTADFTAPELVGTAVFSYEENGIVGSIEVSVIAAGLALITIDSADQLVAGSTNVIPVFGFDEFGNDVPLSVESITFVAPTTVGMTNVSYTESGVTGTRGVQIVPDALASIAVAGPPTLVAGVTGTYTLAGADQFGNGVDLAQSSLDFMSTLAGPTTVSYTELGVTGSLPVTIVHAALTSITLAGPAQVDSATAATYVLTGYDVFGNLVPLAQATLSWTAPNTPQFTQVCYSESGITGCIDVEVVLGPVHSIVLVPSATTINVNRIVTIQATAYDLGGNVLPDAVITWSTTRGAVSNGVFSSATSGLARVSAHSGGVTKTVDIQVTPFLRVALEIEPPAEMAESANVTVFVNWTDHTATPDATLRITIEHKPLGLNTLGTLTRTEVLGATDANGVFRFQLPRLWSLPDDYEMSIVATKIGNTGTLTRAYSL